MKTRHMNIPWEDRLGSLNRLHCVLLFQYSIYEESLYVAPLRHIKIDYVWKCLLQGLCKTRKREYLAHFINSRSTRMHHGVLEDLRPCYCVHVVLRPRTLWSITRHSVVAPWAVGWRQESRSSRCNGRCKTLM